MLENSNKKKSVLKRTDKFDASLSGQLKKSIIYTN